jgi:signal transduction histidine kinase
VFRVPDDLEKPCREEVELLRAALPAVTIDFIATVSTDGEWDASRIKQIVSNLVTNAAKYGDKKSAIRVSLCGDNEKVRLSVENGGPSIPSETLHSLFEPLRRGVTTDLHGHIENLGLGLFIVR